MAEKRTTGSATKMHAPGIHAELIEELRRQKALNERMGEGVFAGAANRATFLDGLIDDHRAGEPFYRTGFQLKLGDDRWYEVGVDDVIRIAPTEHLNDGNRRCNSYVRPPVTARELAEGASC